MCSCVSLACTPHCCTCMIDAQRLRHACRTLSSADRRIQHSLVVQGGVVALHRILDAVHCDLRARHLRTGQRVDLEDQRQVSTKSGNEGREEDFGQPLTFLAPCAMTSASVTSIPCAE